MPTYPVIVMVKPVPGGTNAGAAIHSYRVPPPATWVTIGDGPPWTYAVTDTMYGEIVSTMSMLVIVDVPVFVTMS